MDLGIIHASDICGILSAGDYLAAARLLHEVYLPDQDKLAKLDCEPPMEVFVIANKLKAVLPDEPFTYRQMTYMSDKKEDMDDYCKKLPEGTYEIETRSYGWRVNIILKMYQSAADILNSYKTDYESMRELLVALSRKQHIKSDMTEEGEGLIWGGDLYELE